MPSAPVFRPLAEADARLAALFLRAAFNAGVWGYGDSWVLSCAHALRTLRAPVLITAYSREEADDDADALSSLVSADAASPPAASLQAACPSAAAGCGAEGTAEAPAGAVGVGEATGSMRPEACEEAVVGWPPERNPWGSAVPWSGASGGGGAAAEGIGERLSENRFWQCLAPSSRAVGAH